MNNLKTIIKAMDDFIISLGGSIDPRAVSNRERKALLTFIKTLRDLTPYEIERLIGLAIDHKLTIHNLDGSIGFDQFQLHKETSIEGFRVYSHLGEELISKRG